MAQQVSKYCALLDHEDRILDVDEPWLAFARENGAAELTAEAIRGRPLWEFIAGQAARVLYREIHARVRHRGEPVVIPFRCDSPTLERHMRMTIRPQEAGGLLCESVLLKTELQRPLALLEAAQPRSDAVLTMCSCCKRMLLESDGWLDPQNISTRLRLFDEAKLPQLRYTVCPDCTESAFESRDNGSAA